MIKLDKFSRDYDKRYKIIERSMIKSFNDLYFNKYISTIPDFISTNKTDFPFLFKDNDWTKAYKFLYVKVGLSFANWYAKNFESWVTKSIDPNDYQTTWEQTFANVSAQISAKRITGLTANQRSQLNKLYSKFMRDPKFMSLGVPEQTRILRRSMRNLSKVQATRIVRTETTTASNMAMRESALTMFDKSSLNKTWQSSFLPTSRDGHMELDGETIDESEQFLVVADDGKADLMMFAGDPAGSAGNVCNCTCKTFYIPKTYNERTIGDLNNVGFGLVSNTGSLVTTGISNAIPITGSTTATASAIASIADDPLDQAITGDFSRISNNLGKYIDQMEGLDKSFLRLLSKSKNQMELRLRRIPGRANFNGKQIGRKIGDTIQWVDDKNPVVSLNRLREGFNTSRIRTFVHEFGHAIDHYFNIGSTWFRPGSRIIQRYKVNNPIFKRFFDKFEAKSREIRVKILDSAQKRSADLKALQSKFDEALDRGGRAEYYREIEKTLRAKYGDDLYDDYVKLVSKHGDDVNPQRILSQMKTDALYELDMLEGLVSIYRGSGHSINYMTKKGKAETIAEMFQNKFFGNIWMEKFNKGLFNEMISVVDDWLATLPKQLSNAINYLMKKIKNG